ncbi:UNVERIFIED_CONTAM: hypothetical protein HDU68_009132 [Siphonaria sp. JEL0065]|nr:hypothetical protein HDU68_009132 [Siphonaria sp. JEL0065]
MFANLFNKSTPATAPTGEIATTIIGMYLFPVFPFYIVATSGTNFIDPHYHTDSCTNPAAPEIDWPAVFTIAELIKGYYHTANPGEGCMQAINAIKFRLSAADPVTINYTLSVLDALYKNCEKPFAQQIALKDNLKYLEKFLERPELAPENRGQCLEIIADWAMTTEDPPEIRKFFESLLRAGYQFSANALARLPRGALERIMVAKPNPMTRSFSRGPQPPPAGVPNGYISATDCPPAPQQSIDKVSPQTREQWVDFDIQVSQSCIAMLLETIAFTSPEDSLTKDLAENEIALEGFMRCCDIQGRIIALIPKVKEPVLVEKLLAANASLSAAIDQYNSARLSFWKKRELEGGMSELRISGAGEDRTSPGPAVATTGLLPRTYLAEAEEAEISLVLEMSKSEAKGKGKLVGEPEESKDDEFEQLPGPSGSSSSRV